MFRDGFSRPFFFTQRVLIKPEMSTARTRPYNGGNQQPWKKQKTGYGGGFQPRQQPQQQSLDAMCEVCENGDNVVQREVKKEGPNQGRKFYSCTVCNAFKWADEVESGQPIVLEANKNKFLDKGTNKQQQGTGQIKQIREQYTSPTQGGKEFRNPPAYNPYPTSSKGGDPDILATLTELRQEVSSIGQRLTETTKMVCELHEEFMEFLSRPGGGQQPPEDEMDIGGGEDELDNNKENKPPKH